MYFTESGNHRLIDTGRDLLRSSGPALLLKQGHVQCNYRSFPDCFFNISKDGDTITALSNLCQRLVNLRIQKRFLMFRGTLQCFSGSLHFGLSLSITEPGSIFFVPSLGVFISIGETLLQLSFIQLKSPSSSSFQ